MQATKSAPPKYPSDSAVETVESPLEIKKWWMYNEWHPKCQFSSHIQKRCANRDELNPHGGTAAKELVESVFDAGGENLSCGASSVRRQNGKKWLLPN